MRTRRGSTVDAVGATDAEAAETEPWDRTVLQISVAIALLGSVVLVGWHAHIRVAIQVFPGLNQMQYNSALCFVALGAAGFGLARRRRPLVLIGGAFAALMSAMVILEYAAGISVGIDTLFFHPWLVSPAGAGRMAVITSICFFLTGLSLLIIAVRPRAYGVFGSINAIPLSLALTSLIGYLFEIKYTLPFSLGLQMALHTSVGFLAYGIATLGYAWTHAARGPDGQPKWASGIATAFLPVLFVGSAALLPTQSPAIVVLEILLAAAGVALITAAMHRLTTATMAHKGLLMTAIPLVLLLTFVGLVVHVKRQSESAQSWTLHSIVVLGASEPLAAHVAEAESAVRGYVITGDTAFAASYDRSSALVAETATQLRSLVGDNPSQAAGASRIEEIVVQRMARLTEIVRLINSGDYAGAEAEVKRGAGATLMKQFVAEMATFSREEERLGASRRETLDASWRRLGWLLVAGTAAAILLASVLTLSFSGGATQRLHRLRNNAIRLAAGEALAPPQPGRDEIADLDRVFHDMARSLDEVTRRERAVIQGSTDGIVIKDLEHRYVLVNQGSANFLGLAVEDVVGKTVADLYEPDSVARILAFDEKILAGGESFTSELVAARTGEAARTYSSTYAPYRDRDGALLGVISISRDITAQKRAEGALVDSERRFRDLFYDAPIGYHELDVEGRITCVNTTELALLGYSSDEMIGHYGWEFIQDAELAREDFSEKLREIRPLRSVERAFRRKNRTFLPVQLDEQLLKDSSGRIVGMRATVQDITERKRAEALLKAGALQSAIFNSANFSSIATDARGVIQIFNVGAERMLGYTAAEVSNRITPADMSEPAELIARAGALSLEFATEITPGFDAMVFKATRGIEDIYELTYRRKDGSHLPAMVSVTALRDAQDVIIGYLLIGTDNTARKQVEDERMKLAQRLHDQQRALQQKNVELEDASRMKSEFLANMSHELRTPLNAIIGFSEVLKDGLMGDMNEKQRGFITDIYSSGRHLLSLINDILDLSKVEAGKMLLDLEAVPVASLFRNGISIIRERAEARHIRVVVNAVDSLGAMHADPRKVRQILYNLLSNAVKFSNDGGEVTVDAALVNRLDVGRRLRSWPGRSFPVADSAFEQFIKITVTDTGIGIPADGLERLFTPFNQVDSGLARRFEGTGLGLAMVKLLAELHGGTVAVESALGEGSSFTVWLPLRATSEGASAALNAPAESSSDRALPGARVALVVEDDPKGAELIRVQLEAEGFIVLHAASAEDALAIVAQQPVSLITLDILLPKMDGWEFLNRVKQVPALEHIPIVIISIVADRNQGFALGAAAVMQKPISRRELHAALIELGLLPVADGQMLRVLVVDDDPKAVELIAVRLLGLPSTILRAFGGRDAIEIARQEQPDLVVLDLMMPEVNGFDVVEALSQHAETAQIPVLIVTAKQVTAADRLRLNGFVTTIMGKGEFDPSRFTAEVRRAMAGRHAVT